METQSEDPEEDYAAVVNKLTSMGVHIRGSTTRMSQKITQATDLIFSMTLSVMENCNLADEGNKKESADESSSNVSEEKEVKVANQNAETSGHSDRNLENIVLAKLDTILTVVKRNNENLDCIRNFHESNNPK